MKRVLTRWVDGDGGQEGVKVLMVRLSCYQLGRWRFEAWWVREVDQFHPNGVKVQPRYVPVEVALAGQGVLQVLCMMQVRQWLLRQQVKVAVSSS